MQREVGYLPKLMLLGHTFDDSLTGASIATRGRTISTSGSTTTSKGGASVVSSRGSTVSRGGRRN